MHHAEPVMDNTSTVSETLRLENIAFEFLEITYFLCVPID